MNEEALAHWGGGLLRQTKKNVDYYAMDKRHIKFERASCVQITHSHGNISAVDDISKLTMYEFSFSLFVSSASGSILTATY